jgi:hypothetical protein
LFKNAEFASPHLGDLRERWRTAKDEQGQNKRPSSAKFPPSLAKFGGRIWGGILKRGHSFFSYVEGQSRPFTKVSFQIQIVEKDWMSRQVFKNRYVIGHAANKEFAKQ